MTGMPADQQRRHVAKYFLDWLQEPYLRDVPGVKKLREQTRAFLGARPGSGPQYNAKYQALDKALGDVTYIHHEVGHVCAAYALAPAQRTPLGRLGINAKSVQLDSGRTQAAHFTLGQADPKWPATPDEIRADIAMLMAGVLAERGRRGRIHIGGTNEEDEAHIGRLLNQLSEDPEEQVRERARAAALLERAQTQDAVQALSAHVLGVMLTTGRRQFEGHELEEVLARHRPRPSAVCTLEGD